MASASAAAPAADGAYRTGPPEVAAFAVRPETPGLTLSPNRQPSGLVTDKANAKKLLDWCDAAVAPFLTASKAPAY